MGLSSTRSSPKKPGTVTCRFPAVGFTPRKKHRLPGVQLDKTPDVSTALCVMQVMRSCQYNKQPEVYYLIEQKIYLFKIIP